MALTPRQQRFVEEYLKDCNATQAAIRSGYSVKTAKSIGQENLTKPDIKSAINKAAGKRQQRTEITQDYVLETILETIERCRQVAPVLDKQGAQIYTETPDGDAVPAFEFDAKNVLKGLELLGKHMRLFDPKDEQDRDLKQLEIEKRRLELKAIKDGSAPVAPVTKIEIEVVGPGYGRDKPL